MGCSARVRGIGMFVVVLRTVILFSLVVVVLRLMGKPQIGQLQPYELVVAIMISELAAVPMSDTGIPLLYGVVPILLLLSFQAALSLISLKSARMREIICGRPSILVKGGNIDEGELRRLRMNINDLLEQLRIAGYPDIAEVEFVLLETNGQLSVVPKSQRRPVCPADLGVRTRYEGLFYPLILDGHVEIRHLRELGLDKAWLQNELGKRGIEEFSDVLLASRDTSGNLYLQRKVKPRS